MSKEGGAKGWKLAVGTFDVGQRVWPRWGTRAGTHKVRPYLLGSSRKPGFCRPREPLVFVRPGSPFDGVNGLVPPPLPTTGDQYLPDGSKETLGIKRSKRNGLALRAFRLRLSIGIRSSYRPLSHLRIAWPAGDSRNSLCCLGIFSDSMTFIKSATVSHPIAPDSLEIGLHGGGFSGDTPGIPG